MPAAGGQICCEIVPGPEFPRLPPFLRAPSEGDVSEGDGRSRDDGGRWTAFPCCVAPVCPRTRRREFVQGGASVQETAGAGDAASLRAVTRRDGDAWSPVDTGARERELRLG